MKTLDEVIDDFEKACDLERRCEGCSGCLGQEYGCPNDGAESVPDALFYLKEYRKLDSLDAVAFPEDDNPPLDWSELKQMEGQPVFVEERYRNGDLKSSGWWLIDFWNDDQICMRDQGGNPWNEHRSNYGRDWQAYRKER